MVIPNQPPKGFKDVFDNEAWLENVVSQALTNIHFMRGYKLLKLPIIERETSFSKEVVGSSPWPEWNEKNCIPLSLEDYNDSYRKVGSMKGLLIPEGTVSVARWLSTIVEETNHPLPLKIMYNCPCFRNESIESLVDGHKLRQFDQFGMEILGSSSLYADIETMLLIVDGLDHLGIDRDEILVRLGDIRLYNSLAEKTGLDYEDTIFCKELLDQIAENRAKKEDISELRKNLYQRIGFEHLEDSLRTAWNDLTNVAANHDEISEISEILPSEHITSLKRMAEYLHELGVKSILDLAVVRSHEYYTSVVMEVDVYNENHQVIEVAGGGRYDRLISPFTPEEHPPIPAIGYAYGLQRVCKLLRKTNNDNGIEFTMRLRPEEKLVIPRSGNPAKDYRFANLCIKEGKQADVYLGDDASTIDFYAKSNGADIAR
jgi:histidyl-tRNA synthetase